VFLLPVLVLAAETVAVSEHPEIVSARIVESDIHRTVLEYSIGSFTKAPVDIDGETFYSIALADESPSMESGLPQLPNICRSIVIPDDAEMAVRVVSSHYIDYPSTPAAPSKGHITRDIDPATVAYSFDPFYGSGDWYPSDLAYARQPYIMRDVRGVVVVVNPFQYNAATQTLRVYDRVVVEVVAVGPGSVNVLTARPAVLNAEFRNIYERHFINFDSTDLGRYPAVADAGNMLVICYDDPAFLAAMQPLVEWKNQMGVACEMVTTTVGRRVRRLHHAVLQRQRSDARAPCRRWGAAPVAFVRGRSVRPVVRDDIGRHVPGSLRGTLLRGVGLAG